MSAMKDLYLELSRINLRKNASAKSIETAQKTLENLVEHAGGRAYLYLGNVCCWGCERIGGRVLWAGGSSENEINHALAGMAY